MRDEDADLFVLCCFPPAGLDLPCSEEQLQLVPRGAAGLAFANIISKCTYTIELSSIVFLITRMLKCIMRSGIYDKCN